MIDIAPITEFCSLLLAVCGERRGSGHRVVNGVLLGLVVAVPLAVTVTAGVIVRRALDAALRLQ